MMSQFSAETGDNNVKSEDLTGPIRYQKANQLLKQGVAIDKISQQCKLSREEVDILKALADRAN